MTATVRALHDEAFGTSKLARKRCVIYCRISKDRQGLDLANERQEAECRKQAKALGWDVVAIYRDTDTSAYKRNVKRPGFDAVLAAIEAGEASAVVVYHPDRFVRRNDQLETVIAKLEAALARGGVADFTLASCTGGGYDLSSPTGRMMARTVGAVAQYEVEQKGVRQKSKNVELARDGFWRGGPAPYGYRNSRVALGGGRDATAGTLAIVEAEAVHVRWAVERVLADGWSLNRLCIDLNGRGIRTRRGIDWTRQTMRRLLTTGAIAGRITTKDGQDLGEGNWDPIVPLDQWSRLQVVLKDPRRRTRKAGPTREYLLTGLVYVDGTERKLKAHAREHGRRTYSTAGDAFVKGQQSVIVDAAGLEALVEEMVLRAADERVLLDVSLDQTSNALIARQLAAVDAEEAELVAMRRRGEISLSMLGELSGDLVVRRAELEASLTVRVSVDREVEPYLIEAGRLREAWARFTFAQKRRVLRRIPVRVDVGPATTHGAFDPARVRVTIP